MKRTVENADGIYPRVVRTATTLDDAKALFAEFAAPLPTVSEIITGMVRHAETLLAILPAGDHRDDAQHVVAFCISLRQAIATGNVESVAYRAIELGQHYEQLRVRPCEPKVIHANKSDKGLARGRATKSEKTSKQHAAIRTKVKARMKAHPRDTLNYARQIVADEMGISFATVKRATDGMKPRKKMKK